MKKKLKLNHHGLLRLSLFVGVTTIFSFGTTAYAQAICSVQAQGGSVVRGLCPTGQNVQQVAPLASPQQISPLSPQSFTSTLIPPVAGGSIGQPKWCSHQGLNQNEALICNNSMLSALDLKLNELAMKLSPPPRLAPDRDAKVTSGDVTQLTQWYYSAISQLQAMSSSGQSAMQATQTAMQAGAVPSQGTGIGWCGSPNLSAAEAKICQMSLQYPILSQLDDQLNAAYKTAKKRGIKSQQQSWLAQRDASALTGNAQSVIDLYSQRIKSLQ